jgi:cardiolipin synthase A/B
VRAGSLVTAAVAAILGTAFGGHVARRIRRHQLSQRLMRLADDVPLHVLVEREMGVPMRDGNAVELLEDGAVFDALEDEIRSARDHVHIAEFMWMGKGEPSQRIGRAILNRRRGVTCRIVLDWFGSPRWPPLLGRKKLLERHGELPMFDEDLKRHLEASGVELRFHMPWPDPFRLTHRRIFVFDGRSAIVGGFGIWQSWLGDGVGANEWRDEAARVRGPVVRDLQRAFDRSLQAAGGKPLPGAAYPRPPHAGDVPAAAVASSPAWARTTLAARMYYALMASARRRLYIANSYFVPDRSLQNVLIARAKAGVDVRVLAPGSHHDVPLVHAGQRRTYDRLLRGGVRIWEYEASMMHAKTLVSDDAAVIGSTNVDSQSLSFLWETSIVAEAPRIAARLVERYEVDLSRSREITLDGWRARPLGQKVAQNAAIITEPWL